MKVDYDNVPEPKQVARMVLDQITANPRSHDQRFWEEVGDCGTVRCVAGWTQFLVRGAVYIETSLDSLEPTPRDVSVDAARLLGISDSDKDAEWLFDSSLSKDTVVGALQMLANGDLIDWDELVLPYGYGW